MAQDRGRGEEAVVSPLSLRYQDKTVLVTGAARGIGLAVARGYLSEGAHVVAVDGDAVALASAFSSDEAVTQIASEVGSAGLIQAVEDGPEIHVLVNNVGVSSDRSFVESTMSQVQSTFATNVFGPWELTRRLVDIWLQTPGRMRNVVFVSSLHADKVRMVPDYSCTKAAVEMLVKELAFELGPHGIRVNAVEPGAVDTWSDPSRADHEAHIRASVAQIPLGRLGRPADIARQVMHVSDDQTSSYMTGSILRVDGGLVHYNWLHTLYGSAAAERAIVEELFSEQP